MASLEAHGFLAEYTEGLRDMGECVRRLPPISHCRGISTDEEHTGVLEGESIAVERLHH